jgi:hypothetical protein
MMAFMSNETQPHFLSFKLNSEKTEVKNNMLFNNEKWMLPVIEHSLSITRSLNQASVKRLHYFVNTNTITRSFNMRFKYNITKKL